MATCSESDPTQDTLIPVESREAEVNENSCVKGKLSYQRILCHLTCTVCQEIFKDPITINCGHTFCKDCTNKWAAGKTAMLTCPLCREDIDRTNLDELKKNITIVNMVAELKDPGDCSSDDDREGRCVEHCDIHPGDIIRYLCTTCVVVFCKTCKSFKATNHDPNKHNVYALDTFDFGLLFETLDVKGRAQSLMVDIEKLISATNTTMTALTKIDNQVRRLNNYFLEVFEMQGDEIRQSQPTSEAIHEWNEATSELFKIQSSVEQLNMKVVELDEIENKEVSNWTKRAHLYLKSLDELRFRYYLVEQDLKHIQNRRFAGLKGQAIWERDNTRGFPVPPISPVVFRSTFRKAVSGFKIMEFSDASDYYLERVDWVKNYLLAIDKVKDAAVSICLNKPIIRVIYKNGESGRIISRLCGNIRRNNWPKQTDKCILDFAVTTVTPNTFSKDKVTVCTVVTMGEDLAWENVYTRYSEETVCSVGPSQLLWPYLFYLTEQKLWECRIDRQKAKQTNPHQDRVRSFTFGINHEEDATVSNENAKQEYPITAEDFIICSNNKGGVDCAYVKVDDHNVRKISPNSASFTHVEHQLDLSFLKEVTCMTVHMKDSSLWIIDGSLRALLCFSSDGTLIKVFQINIKGKVYSLNAKQDHLIVLSVCEGDKGVVWGFPFSILS